MKNDDPKAAENLSLVELAGTAPASVGLSWLVVYRFRLFEMCRTTTVKQPKRRHPKSESLANMLDRRA